MPVAVLQVPACNMDTVSSGEKLDNCYSQDVVTLGLGNQCGLSIATSNTVAVAVLCWAVLCLTGKCTGCVKPVLQRDRSAHVNSCLTKMYYVRFVLSAKKHDTFYKSVAHTVLRRQHSASS